MIFPFPAINPSTTDPITTTSERILQQLLQYRRSSEIIPVAPQYARSSFRQQFQQIQQFVATNQPVLFALPSYPCKSPNSDKVLGTLPDMAERLSLWFLKQFCDNINRIYSPGAQIVICSDGHVFGDLINVSDHVIDDYANALRTMIDDEHLSCFDVFNLGNVYDQIDGNQKRHRLLREWARPIADIREELMRSEENLQLYRGITRFLVEDTASYNGISKTALQRQCRQRALSVIQRSWAWGNLVAQYYPKAIRLSIHPQPAGSTKFGIALSNAPDKWMTPWHGVSVLTRSGYVFMRHDHAKRIGNLVHLNGVPSHYVTSHADAS